MQAGDSTVLVDGEGKSARVLGLSSYQRATFLKLLMLHGYGDGTWTHFLGRALGNLRCALSFCILLILSNIFPWAN